MCDEKENKTPWRKSEKVSIVPHNKNRREKPGIMKGKMHAKSQTKDMGELGDDIQEHVSALWETGRDKTLACMHATDHAIRENPYQAIGIALGIGLLAGLLLNRSHE